MTSKFPLFRHATGRWAKKVCGKLRYFGKVADDPEGKAALSAWEAQKDVLLAGNCARKVVCVTVGQVCERFLAAKRHLVETGEICGRTFAELSATCRRLEAVFGVDREAAGLGPVDFDRLRRQIAESWGPVRLGNEIQRVRSVFKFGLDYGMLAEGVKYGAMFAKPSRKVLRLERAKRGPRMLEAAEAASVLEWAGVPLRAMVLLGLNCGFGNADVAGLPMAALDLERGWVTFPRPKTGVPRRCPLWPETVGALRAALAQRPRSLGKAAESLVFLTKFGRPWRCSELDGDRLRQSDAVSREFVKVLGKLGLHRPGLGFYALRHTFETVGGDAGDQVAVDAIMGHVRDDMATVYRERISPERLLAVTNYVRNWLLAGQKEAGKEAGSRSPGGISDNSLVIISAN